jgi:hypothetical protein
MKMKKVVKVIRNDLKDKKVKKVKIKIKRITNVQKLIVYKRNY